MLPYYSSPKRDHFSVVHELGHYFLHSNRGETPLIAFRVETSRSDWEANYFAAGLVIPADLFRAEVSKTDSIYQVATKFGVSTEVATIRKGGDFVPNWEWKLRLKSTKHRITILAKLGLSLLHFERG